MKCFSFEMTVDSDLTNYNDLVGSVVERYPPGYMEVAHVQHYDEVLKSFPEITTDKQLMTMSSKHCKSKVIIMFIAYCDPSDAFEAISELDFNDERQPDNNTETVNTEPIDTNTEPVEDDYLKNPLPQNEHVGVDEEIMYLDNEPVNCLAVVPSSDKGKRDSAMCLLLEFLASMYSHSSHHLAMHQLSNMLTCITALRSLELHIVSLPLLCLTRLSGRNPLMIFSCTHLY
jgi:hypothetical protein